MNVLQRGLLVVTTALTVVGVTGIALSASPPVSGELRAVGASVAQAVAAIRPAAFAPADAAATEFLPPIGIVAGQDVTLQDKLTLTGTMAISCGPFITTSFSFADIQVSEPSGSDIANASGEIPKLICDGALHTYGFTAAANNAPFHPSSGRVQVFVDACGTASDLTPQCQSAEAIAAVSIKR